MLRVNDFPDLRGLAVKNLQAQLTIDSCDESTKNNAKCWQEWMQLDMGTDPVGGTSERALSRR
jgi:hypothetical protein